MVVYKIQSVPGYHTDTLRTCIPGSLDIIRSSGGVHSSSTIHAPGADSVCVNVVPSLSDTTAISPTTTLGFCLVQGARLGLSVRRRGGANREFMLSARNAE